MACFACNAALLYEGVYMRCAVMLWDSVSHEYCKRCVLETVQGIARGTSHLRITCNQCEVPNSAGYRSRSSCWCPVDVVFEAHFIRHPGQGSDPTYTFNQKHCGAKRILRPRKCASSCRGESCTGLRHRRTMYRRKLWGIKVMQEDVTTWRRSPPTRRQ